MLLRAHTMAGLQLTFWSVVVDDRLGAGEQVDVLALDELGAALRRLPAML